DTGTDQMVLAPREGEAVVPLTVEEDDSSTAVLITKLQFDRQGDEEATEEEIALANSLGIFALDLSDERTSSEAAATTPTVFKGIEELTDEELRKSVVYTLPRGSVGISNAMKEMNLGQPLSKALTKGVQKGSGSAGLNLSTKAPPPVPPKKAPQPKATSSTDTDVFMRPTDVPGKASASTPKEPLQPPPKKMPVQRAPSPAAKTAAKTAARPASPPGREGTWIKGTDLPPLSAGTRPISDEKKRRLGGKCTFILRGFTNKPEYGDRTPNIRLRAGDLSADWEEFLSALGQIWRGLRVSDIMQVFQQPPDGKARYEVFAKVTSEHEIAVLRVRCMQGHSGEMLSDYVDILETHAAVHTFVDWDASLTTRPKIGAYDLYSVSFQQFPHKLGYHGTYQRNFANITKYGLVPGGMITRSGLRANAEIEFVIDLQLAVLDGLRLLETKAGALETPDWISNKYLVYAYKRGSAEPIWANPAYPAFRLRVDKALDGWDKDGATPYILDPDEDMYNRYDCFLDLLDDALSDYIGEWAPVAADSKVPYYLQTDPLTGVKGGYQIRKNPTTDDYAEASQGEYGRSLCVWVSKAGRSLPPRARREPEHWIKNELINIPGFVCSQCSNKYVDGMVECGVCRRRLGEITDLSVIAEPDRQRRLAALEGRLPNIIDLQPSAGLNKQRVRASGKGEEASDRVQSTASTIRAKVINQQKQADHKFSTTPQDRMNIDPLQAHNFAKAGLSFFTVEALQRFANVRLPNPRGKGKGKGSATLYDATGKLAFVWVTGQSEIDLLTECLVCFHDRFYTIDEIAVFIKAVKSNQQEFSVLLFNGEKHHMVQNEILAIMSELANVFARELPQSRAPDELGYPELVLSRELAVPPGVSELGHRQLNQLLANTPYFQRQPQYFMDRRIGQSSVARQRFTTSAPAQERRPPAPPAPTARRGRSSDERASPRTGTERNRTRSPIGRNRPTETHIRTSGSAFLGDRPDDSHTAASSSGPTPPENPPPRRAQRDPNSYISDDDWAAMRSGRPFTAPETDASAANDTGSVASEISSVIDLTRPAQWAERYRRRPNDPVTFGYFSDTVRISDRERRARQTVVDFFEQLETAGFLYANFRLGYDEFGNMIDPNYARRLGWNRVDQYQWAVFACMTEEVYIAEHVINMIPSHDNPHGFTSMDTSHVQWYLQGWRHEVYNHRTGHRDRLY
ncbi:CML4, partial [Symbiodinium sp. KB8]